MIVEEMIIIIVVMIIIIMIHDCHDYHYCDCYHYQYCYLPTVKQGCMATEPTQITNGLTPNDSNQLLGKQGFITYHLIYMYFIPNNQQKLFQVTQLQKIHFG